VVRRLDEEGSGAGARTKALGVIGCVLSDMNRILALRHRAGRRELDSVETGRS
jgi:hypothetical protein